MVVDGQPQPQSLFQMIQRSTEASPGGVLSAYRDNAAVIEGHAGGRFFPDPQTGVYGAQAGPTHIVMKVETHNHPTAISPFPGAATGSGGEIRDEGATGRGARPKAGLTGFSVSNLRLPGAGRPWEKDHGKPDRIASALEIMIEAPLGGAAFNNEFGRPNLAGYFRTFEMEIGAPRAAGRRLRLPQADHGRGWLGHTRPEHATKPTSAGRGHHRARRSGDAHRSRRRRRVVGVLGLVARGSRFRVGAARQRRDAAALPGGDRSLHCARRRNPIQSIHDVGAGGFRTRCPSWSRQRPRGASSPCAPSPPTSPGCRRSSCGATRRRSVTCWRSRPTGWRVRGARGARALSVRGRGSGHRRWPGGGGGRRRRLLGVTSRSTSPIAVAVLSASRRA